MSGNRVVCVLPLSTILFDNACCKREREGPTGPRSAPRLSARLTTMAEMVWASSGVRRQPYLRLRRPKRPALPQPALWRSAMISSCTTLSKKVKSSFANCLSPSQTRPFQRPRTSTSNCLAVYDDE